MVILMVKIKNKRILRWYFSAKVHKNISILPCNIQPPLPKEKKTNREYVFTILPIYTFSCDTYIKLLSGTT